MNRFGLASAQSGTANPKAGSTPLLGLYWNPDSFLINNAGEPTHATDIIFENVTSARFGREGQGHLIAQALA